ncbi:DNA-entry nuclease [Ligilactobacillus sp. WC1T17]|uniref:DNA-entry nuclease n=1 Tax=Ligilactobacillus ruminis TaxID=1623 RepID=A0ABY1AD43_9LACO|nr:DNA-entry nuclease [Ligilactobacillus ruminis]
MQLIGFIIILAGIYLCLWTYKNKPRQRWLRYLLSVIIFLLALIVGSSAKPAPKKAAKTVTKTKLVKKGNYSKRASSLESKNAKLAASLSSQKRALTQQKKALDQKKQTKSSSSSASSVSQTTQNNLADLTYSGIQTVTINNNQPNFSRADLSTSKGPWQTYKNLDALNRVTGAEALLNQKLMPTAKREELTIDPTGWHNKRTASGGWLYNRCHLIGYQLTGQNNNWKNLMTGTRSLNDPGMTTYENQIAAYLKQSSKHYVRYSVTPIFKDNELLARGVWLRGQSIGDNQIHFSVYIFNVESGYTLNYNDGTSTVSN